MNTRCRFFLNARETMTAHVYFMTIIVPRDENICSIFHFHISCTCTPSSGSLTVWCEPFGELQLAEGHLEELERAGENVAPHMHFIWSDFLAIYCPFKLNICQCYVSFFQYLSDHFYMLNLLGKNWHINQLLVQVMSFCRCHRTNQLTETLPKSVTCLKCTVMDFIK